MFSTSEIIERAADLWEIRPADLLGKSRARHVVRARQAAAWALRECTDLSLVEIGKLLKRDHTTVMYALETIAREIREDHSLRDRVHRLSRVAMGVQLERRDPAVDRWLREAGI